MNSYNLQKRISSFNVDKKLIQDVEDFFSKDMPEIIPWTQISNSDLRIGIRIYDSFGEEFLSTIQDYKRQLFRNDIKALTVEYRKKTLEKSIEVFIRFSKKIDETDITISLTDQKARESIAAIKQGLESVLNQKKNTNWFLYPNETLGLVISLTGAISGIILLSDKIQPIFRKISGVMLILLVTCYIARTYLKPYSSFETNRQKRNDTIFNWFFLGLIGFILFTTIATSVRREVFGF